MNRNAQVISFGLLPIVALAVCAISIFTFVAYNSNVSKPMQEVSEAIKILDFNENYVVSTIVLAVKESSLEVLTNEKFRAILLSKDRHIEGQGNIFVLVDEEKFILEKNGANYVIKITGLFVSAEKKSVKLRRNFDIMMEFSDKGELVRFINK